MSRKKGKPNPPTRYMPVIELLHPDEPGYRKTWQKLWLQEWCRVNPAQNLLGPT